MQIPEHICNHLEGLSLDLEGTKDLIAFLLRDSLVDRESLDYYKKQYDELYIQCELMKREITEQWAGGNPHWMLDYASGELTVREGCSCGRS